MKFLKHKMAGDTLIEVLLAFTILSSVIGVAFSGAMGSYRSAVSAQNRTQALFLAQYQADGLKTYRDSLDWDNGGGLPSFLNGPVTVSGSTLGSGLVPLKSNNDYLSGFCMNTTAPASALTYWRVDTNSQNCTNLARALAPNLKDPNLSIAITAPSGTTDRLQATVTVSYKPAGASDANYTEKVTNSIILIR